MQDLFHQLVALDIIAAAPVPGPHRLPVPPEAYLLRPRVSLLNLYALALEAPSRTLGHRLVSQARLVTEVDLEDLAARGWWRGLCRQITTGRTTAAQARMCASLRASLPRDLCKVSPGQFGFYILLPCLISSWPEFCRPAREDGLLTYAC